MAGAARLDSSYLPDDFYGFPGQPPWPTVALPGSDAKIQLLSERAEMRWELHHPQDAR